MSSDLVMSEHEAIELAAYLVSCADISRNEPDLYGPVRLLEAAKRLAKVVLEHGIDEGREFWRQLYDEVEQKLHWYDYDMEGWSAFVDQMPVLVASELKRRASRRLEGK